MSRTRIDPAPLSDLFVYTDEIGDHGLTTIDAGYPIFALAFVVMTRDEYMDVVMPALQRVKFDYCGRRNVRRRGMNAAECRPCGLEQPEDGIYLVRGHIDFARTGYLALPNSRGNPKHKLTSCGPFWDSGYSLIGSAIT